MREVKHDDIREGDIIKTRTRWSRVVKRVYNNKTRQYSYLYRTLLVLNDIPEETLVHETNVVRAFTDCTLEEIKEDFPEEFI